MKINKKVRQMNEEALANHIINGLDEYEDKIQIELDMNVAQAMLDARRRKDFTDEIMKDKNKEVEDFLDDQEKKEPDHTIKAEHKRMGLDESLFMESNRDVYDEVVDEIEDIIYHSLDNVANEIAVRVKDYDLDWCMEDALYPKEQQKEEQLLRNLAKFEADILFKNCNLNESKKLRENEGPKRYVLAQADGECDRWSIMNSYDSAIAAKKAILSAREEVKALSGVKPIYELFDRNNMDENKFNSMFKEDGCVKDEACYKCKKE